MLSRWERTIVDDYGNRIDQPQVMVQHERAGTPLAVLKADIDGTVPLDNPFIPPPGVDPFFYAAGGLYRITVTKGGYSRPFRHVQMGTAAATDSPPLNPRSSWDGETQYNVNDVVLASGGSYIATAPSLGIEPAVTDDWEQVWTLLVEKGAKGDTGDTGPAGDPGEKGEKGDPGDGITGGVLWLTEQSVAPPAPSAGTKLLYAKDDGKVYTRSSTGAVVEVGAGAGGRPELLACGRLTLTTGVPETTSDVTAATQIYFTPMNGNVLGLYDGAEWQPVVFTEKSLKATNTQTGTTSSSAATITGLTDTSQLVVGMEVSGTGVPASRTVASIDSPTQITMSGNGNASGSNAITFKLPAGKNYDVFGKLVSDELKLFFGPVWTSDTTRATAISQQDGIDVLSGDATRRLLGTIRTTAIAGQLEDSKARRYVSNRYNRRPRPMCVQEATPHWYYGSPTMRQVRGQASNQLEYVSCIGGVVWAATVVTGTATTSAQFGTGIGFDGTTDVSIIRAMGYVYGTNLFANAQAYYSGASGIGRHYLTWLESGNIDPEIIFGGTLSGAGLQQIVQTGIIGEVEG